MVTNRRDFIRIGTIAGMGIVGMGLTENEAFAQKKGKGKEPVKRDPAIVMVAYIGVGGRGGGHDGSHGNLMNEFVTSIIQDRKPLVDIAWALNLTVAGIVAHNSALKDGELMKIPQYRF